MIPLFSFNFMAKTVVFGTLLISRSDEIIGTFFHSGRFFLLFNKDSVVCCSLCNIGLSSCCATLAPVLKSTLAWFSSKSLILKVLKSASKEIKLKKDSKWSHFFCFSPFLVSFINCLYGGDNIYGPSPYTGLSWLQ